MKKAAAIVGIFALMASFAAIAPQAANAAPARGNTLAIPVSGSNSLSGTFRLTGFAMQEGKLVATGIVTGSVVDNSGATVGFLQTVTAPVVTPSASSAPTTAATTASCPILHLVLGPIALDVLGLTVTTNQIVLDISAVPGPGNLLGNLLCDVANLLNTPNQTLANLLNQIVAILGGL